LTGAREVQENRYSMMNQALALAILMAGQIARPADGASGR
jgi:hypothetical protein